MDEWVRGLEGALGASRDDAIRVEASVAATAPERLRDPDGELYRVIAATVPEIERLPAALAALQAAIERLEAIPPGDPQRPSAEIRFQAALTDVWAFSPPAAERLIAAGGLPGVVLGDAPSLFADPVEGLIKTQSGVLDCSVLFPPSPDWPGVIDKAFNLSRDCTAECTGFFDDIACFNNDGPLEDLVDAVCLSIGGACNAANAFEAQVLSLVSQISSFTGTVQTAIDGFYNDLTTLPGKVEAEFNSLPGRVEDGLRVLGNAALSALPDDETAFFSIVDAFSGVDLGSPDWWNDLGGALEGARVAPEPSAGESGRIAAAAGDGTGLACPADGTDIPGVGEIGTARAEYLCKGWRETFEGIFRLAPADAAPWSIAIRVAAGSVFFPIEYICLCVESSSKIAHMNESFDFQSLVGDQVDVAVSSRATETGLNLLIDQTGSLDQQAAATAPELHAGAAETERTSEVLESSEQLLQVFGSLSARLDLEAEVLEADPKQTRLAAPAAQGGRIEEVRSLVSALIESFARVGLDVGRARRLLAQGDGAASDGRYRQAFAKYQEAYRTLTSPPLFERDQKRRIGR